MKKIVYILGNPLLSSDSLPLKLLPKLRQLCPQFSFQIFDPTEEFSFAQDQELILIDTVIGIEKVAIFRNLNHFAFSPRVTTHDFDLPVSLGILAKLGKIKKVTIIGIPPKGEREKIAAEVKEILID